MGSIKAEKYIIIFAVLLILVQNAIAQTSSDSGQKDTSGVSWSKILIIITIIAVLAGGGIFAVREIRRRRNLPNAAPRNERQGNNTATAEPSNDGQRDNTAPTPTKTTNASNIDYEINKIILKKNGLKETIMNAANEKRAMLKSADQKTIILSRIREKEPAYLWENQDKVHEARDAFDHFLELETTFVASLVVLKKFEMEFLNKLREWKARIQSENSRDIGAFENYFSGLLMKKDNDIRNRGIVWLILECYGIERYENLIARDIDGHLKKNDAIEELIKGRLDIIKKEEQKLDSYDDEEYLIVELLCQKIALQAQKLEELKSSIKGNVSNAIPQAILSNGMKIPMIGLGTWQLEGDRARLAVENALANGYTHIDTSENYGNEEAVGKAIGKSKIPRQQLFITTKIDPENFHDPRKALLESLKRLRTEYVDLYLIHWPYTPTPEQMQFLAAGDGTYVDAWRGLVRLYEEGLCKAIGVSNFGISHLKRIILATNKIPMVNQIECHPFNTEQELREFCKSKGILIEAFSPLTSGQHQIDDRTIINLMENELIGKIAQKHKKTNAQILLRWGIQNDMVVLPRSTNTKHQQENKAIFDFELSPEDMRQLGDLNKDFEVNMSAPGWRHFPP